MLRIALLVSLGLVAAQAQTDVQLPGQRAERILRGRADRLPVAASERLAEVRQRIADLQESRESRPSWRERIANRGADARRFDAVDEAAELQQYANNYDGRTPNRYDPVNPTYRREPPAGLVCYGTAAGCGYLNYYRDPAGRWLFNAADETADNAFSATWRQGQAPQISGRDFDYSINRQGANWAANGNVKYDSKREGLPGVNLNFNFGKPRQLNAEPARAPVDWRRIFGNQDFDRSFDRRGDNWDLNGNVKYDAKQDGFPGYNVQWTFGKPASLAADDQTLDMSEGIDGARQTMSRACQSKCQAAASAAGRDLAVCDQACKFVSDHLSAELQQWSGGVGVQAPQGGSPTFNGNVNYQGNNWNAQGSINYNPSLGGNPGYNVQVQFGGQQRRLDAVDETLDGEQIDLSQDRSAVRKVLAQKCLLKCALSAITAGADAAECTSPCDGVAEHLSAELQQWSGNVGVSAPQGGSPTFNGGVQYNTRNGGYVGGQVNYDPRNSANTSAQVKFGLRW